MSADDFQTQSKREVDLRLDEGQGYRSQVCIQARSDIPNPIQLSEPHHLLPQELPVERGVTRMRGPRPELQGAWFGTWPKPMTPTGTGLPSG
jgi:hypothetical protein